MYAQARRVISQLSDIFCKHYLNSPMKGYISIAIGVHKHVNVTVALIINLACLALAALTGTQL